ncbi:MAG: hypothetical protein ACFCUG_13515 [Thiotrichales bacterium]
MPDSSKLTIKHYRAVMLLGIAASLVGLVGAIGVGAVLAYLIAELVAGRLHFLLHQVIFQAVWWIFFASLFTVGLHLILSSITRRRRDLVPGIALYFLGLALVVNGLILLLYSDPFYGLTALLIGVVLVFIEWRFDIT